MSKVESYEGAIDRGLEGIVACSSAISTIHGSTLLYRGYTIEDLAEHATFEEVIHLLWRGTIPDAEELAELRTRLGANMKLPEEMRVWLVGMPVKVHPMDFLSAVVAGLTLHDPEANVIHEAATRSKATRLTARLGVIVGAYEQARKGRWPLEPDPNRSLSWNLLRGITGKAPTPQQERDFDVCLILHADHELNASAFSARVTASTLSGLYSSVLAAIGTLKGPLHGGANQAVIAMLRQIGSLDRVDRWLDDALARDEKIMGFGHRVYKDGDPRAKVLKKMSERLTSEVGRPELYRMSVRLEERMAEKKGLIPNVDFYSATVYEALGIPDDLFTAIFAASRVVGWCAHVMEQYENNRIYRPRARYVGPTEARYAESRGTGR
ncbi:MAG: citrate/2-methylcitrate synthase [Myxococcota bacterium]